jgi:hypothetical protein
VTANVLSLASLIFVAITVAANGWQTREVRVRPEFLLTLMDDCWRIKRRAQ